MGVTHIVTRVIHGPDGELIEAGARVDGSKWANTKKLVGAGQLRPLTPADFEADSDLVEGLEADLDAEREKSAQLVAELAAEKAKVASLAAQLEERDGFVTDEGEHAGDGEPAISDDPEPKPPKPLEQLESLDDRVVALLTEAGFETVEAISEASDEDLVAIKGVGEATLRGIRAAVSG